MTFTIDKVKSYRPLGDHNEFIVDGELNGVQYEGIAHIVPSTYEEADAICEEWLRVNNTLTPSRISRSRQIVEERRAERAEVFAATLDKVNPIWLEALDGTQRLQLVTWRQAWLDYPNKESNKRPDDLDIFT